MEIVGATLLVGGLAACVFLWAAIFAEVLSE